MAVPRFDICILPPTTIALDVAATSIQGGRSLSGVTQNVDFSGGGFVTLDYFGISLETPEEHLAWNAMAGWLSGSVRSMLVPLWTDHIAPKNASGAVAGSYAFNVPHSDGKLFTDGRGYMQNMDFVTTMDAYPANTSVIRLNYPTGFKCAAGQWFSIYHAVKGAHAYRIINILNAIAPNDAAVVIQPPLREATPISQACDFYRPVCKMKLKEGFEMPWRWQAPGSIAVVDVSFEEALP